MSDTNSFSATMYMYMYKGMKNNVADFAERTAFKRYGVKKSEKANMHMSTGLPRPGLARSAHRGQIGVTKGIRIQVQRCSRPTHDNVASL